MTAPDLTEVDRIMRMINDMEDNGLVRDALCRPSAAKFPSAADMPSAYVSVPTLTCDHSGPTQTSEQIAYARGWADRGKRDGTIVTEAYDKADFGTPQQWLGDIAATIRAVPKVGAKVGAGVEGE